MIFKTKKFSCFTKKILCICVYFFPEKTTTADHEKKKAT